MNSRTFASIAAAATKSAYVGVTKLEAHSAAVGIFVYPGTLSADAMITIGWTNSLGLNAVAFVLDATELAAIQALTGKSYSLNVPAGSELFVETRAGSTDPIDGNTIIG